MVLGASLATVGRVGTGAIAAALLCEHCTASPEQIARQGACVLSSIDHDNAVDDHHVGVNADDYPGEDRTGLDLLIGKTLF